MSPGRSDSAQQRAGKGVIACLNVGSSSIKFALYRVGAEGDPVRLGGGRVEETGTAPRLLAAMGDTPPVLVRAWPAGAVPGQAALLHNVLDWMHSQLDGERLAACGHRVVHGGTRLTAPVAITEQVLEQLVALESLAPLHQPHNLAPIHLLHATMPDLPQAACFDTAFHATMPDLATRFALPRALHDRGIRRYGFHGLSYAYLARRLAQCDPAAAQGRVIAAHLGNGASLCAMQAGRSIDTTMGFTALDGLMMGTRSGSLDPGVVLHLIQQEGMSAKAVEDLLYRGSGLLGVSGLSSDTRDLAASDAPEADQAIALFCRRAAKEAAALMTSLGGLDALVFTAGIGEHQPAIRARICAALGWCGLVLDPQANLANAALISAPESRVVVRVIPTDEEAMIARGTIAALGLNDMGLNDGDAT